MSKDIRVILIKISDRLHNMRTMEYQTPAKQKQKSLETMEIYAPIAHRLGMQRMKWELEDLSLKYLDPIGYDEIVSKLDAKRPEYDALMSRTQAQIDQRLNEMGIKHIVYGRMKHPYSIYRKMFSQNKSLDEIFDLFAFRVVVDTVSDCPTATRVFTPPSWATRASPLRCRSAPRRCTRSPSTAWPPTGSISRTVRVPAPRASTSGYAVCWKIRKVPMLRSLSTP